jgi:hypothetical protein
VLLNNGHLYNVASGTIEDLTEGSGGFVGAAGYGADLGQVYFVDTKVLTEELNGHSDKAQSGQLNLYAWNEAGTRFIGTLLPSDDAEGASETIGLSRDWAAIPTVRTAGASPTGRYLAFMSKASLTGFNNEGPPRAHCAVKSGAFASGPCAEVFLYDSAANQLICASCNSSGATPLGWSQVPVAEGPRSLPQARFLTDSGRLYFDSGDSLSQFDVNAGAQDVYEWEPQGIGTCGTVGGCVALISSGTEGRDSNFTTVDPSGANVFFTTRNQLVPQDQDELIDLYDAREFGGFSGDEVIAPAECQGEGCQSAPGVSGEAPPASSSVSGSGNVKQQSCKKGQVKKKGKCVKKAKKHKQHKKSGKGSKHGGAR